MLESLRVIDFRCFESLSVEVDSSMVFFTGGNAQGKTSLLEAVAVVSRLGSPRASRQSHIIREGANGCGVAIQTTNGFFKSIYQEGKFELSIDGQPVTRAEYLSRSPRVVWMENRDLELIRGSGDKRRRFLDSIGSQLSAEYTYALRSYTKALRSRNALLKENRFQDGSFKVFTDLLVQHGATLMDFRKRMVEKLLPYMAAAHSKISGANESFDLKCQISAPQLTEGLQENFQKDIVLKQTTVGPHRDDFSLLVDGRPASDFASEGQQRTLAVSLRLAQGELMLNSIDSDNLIYLVDDVFGELDQGRRAALMESLPASCLKLLTTTSLHWSGSHGCVYTVNDRKLQRV